MGLLSITEMIAVIRKHFVRIIAFALVLGLLGGLVTSLTQTYTCTLGFKYNYEDAEKGLAPDGTSKLDPYEIQNPVVVQGALYDMGLDSDKNAVNGIREQIVITPIKTDLDQEVSDSAALLGEKYDVLPTEYEMSFKYKASSGDNFGTQMFSKIIKQYDEFLLKKYYNKSLIKDFAKTVANSDAEYIEIADDISTNIEDAITYLDELSESNPDFRSSNTGYTFSELSDLYQNLRDIQYAKYYGNVRAGNLAVDNEMVIKSYKTKVKDLQNDANVDSEISENYKQEISSFYNSYKEAGLYRQAEQVQRNADSSNNRDQDVIEDYRLEDYKNTYDEIILNYTNYASNATDAIHTINYYNSIIQAYTEDAVPQSIKQDLIKKNEKILVEITDLSKKYSEIANKTISELYDGKISDDLQYLIAPEVNPDKPIMLVVIFLIILGLGLGIVFILIYSIVKKSVNFDEIMSDDAEFEDEKVVIDTTNMDELHQLLYEQYLADFKEFFLVYQTMVPSNNDAMPHKEVFIRWRSPKIGMVSPGKIIAALADLDIFRQFNDWLLKNICDDLAKLKDAGKQLPVVHVNCPYSQVETFDLNDIIIKHIKDKKIPTENICLELVGKDIVDSLENIQILSDMGIGICIDRFENSDEETEIIQVVKPKYIKMSLDVLNSDIYATSDDDIMDATSNMITYFADVIAQCRNNGISTCICGIENDSQDRLVSKVGFDYKQGFFYSKPEKLN